MATPLRRLAIAGLGAWCLLGPPSGADAAGPRPDPSGVEATTLRARWAKASPSEVLAEADDLVHTWYASGERLPDEVLAAAIAARYAAMQDLGRDDRERVLEEAVATATGALADDGLARPLWLALLARARQAAEDDAGAIATGFPALEALARAAEDDARPDLALLDALRLLLATLAVAHEQTGKPAVALELRRRQVEVTRRAYGDADVNTADALGRLATTASAISAYDVARASFQEALAIRLALPDSASDREIPRVLFRLAKIVILLGDPDGAFPLLDQALAHARGAKVVDQDLVRVLLNSQAIAYDKRGDRAKAKALYEEVLAGARSAGDLSLVGAVLFNLAVLAKADGDVDQAEALLREAIRAHEARGAGGSSDVGHALSQLGATLSHAKRFTEAIEVLQRGLAIRERTLGPENPSLITPLINLARMEEHALGDLAAAHAHRERALTIAAPLLGLLDALPEREALSFLDTAMKARNEWLRTEEDPVRAWSQVLATKGLVAARLRHAHARALADPATAELAKELQEVRAELARRALSAEAGRADDVAALQARRDDLEANIRAASGQPSVGETSSTAAAPTPAELCAALPPASAVVDAVRYSMKWDTLDAFVMRADDCAVWRVELGGSAAIEEAVLAWRGVLAASRGLQSRADRRGARVYRLLWEPLLPYLEGIEHVFFVPDGQLAVAPLGALPVGDDRYLLETVQVTYLDRANDLVRPPAVPSGEALVVGGVDFGQAPASPAGAAARNACRVGPFQALPGTVAEADDVAARLRGGAVLPLTGSAAEVRAVVGAMPGKEIIHMATHGFALPDQCDAELVGDRSALDPLVRSGVVLAGANDPESDEDGLLTAAEVAGLDLDAARLVVLSACGTGLGDAVASEGVLGLRRGFTIGGARSIVMSLWNVPDADTVTLMDEFYRGLERRRGGSAADALRAAQLAALRDQRRAGQVDATGWGAFALAGDWR